MNHGVAVLLEVEALLTDRGRGQHERPEGLPDTRLYRLDAPTRTPAGVLLADPVDTDRIRQGWEDMLRCAASLRDGTVTASLLVARPQAAGRHLPLTRALQEYGRLIKTRFVLRYLADPAERRAIGRQLNKAESLHALHDQLFHGRHGHVRLHIRHRNERRPVGCRFPLRRLSV